MIKTCILCGCLCLTGLPVSGRMLCCGCESALLRKSSAAYPELLAFYHKSDFLPASTENRHTVVQHTGFHTR